MSNNPTRKEMREGERRVYRKLIAYPVFGYLLGSVLVARFFTDLQTSTGARGLTADPAALGMLAGGTGGMLLVGVTAGMVRAAAFDPGRRYPLWAALGKYAAVAAGLLLALAVLLQRSLWTGMRAWVLYGQTDASVLRALTASLLPRSLPEAIALSFFLAAPFYWLVRGVQVRSLQRATFEAWVEARRLLFPGIALLLAGMVLEAWAGPALTTWILR